MKTLSTILNQDFEMKEVIVVDDHSTDGTYDFLASQYEDKIVLIKNRGKGPGAARNTGLHAATGKFIKFFDSDDLMTSNMLRSQYDSLKRSSNGFVYSPYFYATEDEHGEWKMADDAILNYFPFDREKPLHYWMAVKNLFITIPGMMFKKTLLDKVGPWRTDVTASEDWDYLWRISMIEPHPTHTNECAFLYRVHGQQTTEGNFSNVERDIEKYRVLLDIHRRDVVGRNRLSGWPKLAFENKLLMRTDRVRIDRRLYGKLNDFQTPLNRLIWQIVRLDQKIGRIRTGTNWQPCHGPLVSSEKLRHYLGMIN